MKEILQLTNTKPHLKDRAHIWPLSPPGVGLPWQRVVSDGAIHRVFLTCDSGAITEGQKAAQ